MIASEQRRVESKMGYRVALHRVSSLYSIYRTRILWAIWRESDMKVTIYSDQLLKFSENSVGKPL